MTIPGGYTAGDVLTAADMNLLPAGVLVTATASASDQTGITTATDITGASVTFTAVAGRRYRAVFNCTTSQQSAAGNQTLTLLVGATGFYVGTTTVADGSAVAWQVSQLFTVAAGSQTVKAQLTTSAGSASVVNSSSRNATIHVEDVGEA